MSKFTAQTVIYGVGIFLPRAVGFLLLPLYTHFLTPVDYGILAALDMLGMYFGIVVQAGFASAMLRFYHEKDEENWHHRVFITCFLVTVFVFILAVPFILSSSHLLAVFILDNSVYGLYLALIFLTFGIDVPNHIVLTLFRLEEKANFFLSLILYRLIFSVVFNVYFIAFLKIGILGFILSSLISNFAIFLTISLFSVWQRRTRPNFALARSLLRFALPYIPAGMVEAILNNLGVMALTITGNFALVGLYSIGQKLASVTAIAYQPIGTAWLPQMYKISKQDDAPRIYARATTMILMLLGAIIVFLSVMAHEIVALIAPESYDGASIVILPVAIGYMIYALRSTIRIGITLGDRTSYIPGLSSIVLLLGFPITLLAAYKFGAVGAAVGVSGVMIATVLLTGHVSQRFYRVPYEWSRLMRLAAILLVCVTCGNLVPADLFVAKLAVLALYPLLVLLFGALTDDEKRRLLIGLRLRKD